VVVVVSGPSGVGKSSVVRKLLEALDWLTLSVSATTRRPRAGERNGVDYHFVTESRFRHMTQTGRMLEWAQVFSHFYGTPASELERARREGKVLLLDIDVEGARQLRERGIDGLYVFLLPPSEAELERRLRGRGTEDEEQMRRRLERARFEMGQKHIFDSVVVNDSLDKTVEEVVNLLVERFGEHGDGPGRRDKKDS